MTRCFCCHARVLQQGGVDWHECWSCGARWRSGQSGRVRAYEQGLADLAKAGPVAAERMGAQDWFVDAVTLRIAASRYGLWFTCDDHTAFDGHRVLRPSGRLWPLTDTTALRLLVSVPEAAAAPVPIPVSVPVPEPLPVALIVLAREVGAVLTRFLEAHAAGFAETVVVLDGHAPHERHTLTGAQVTTVYRKLDGDFASQRNAGHAAASADWVFHLDLDETIAPDLAKTLGHVARRAQDAGLRAVGLPRRNLVDGVLSDLFPDTQYRLMPRMERFENRVHERPVACRDWTATTICQLGSIAHHLSRERVVQRSRAYDKLGQSPDRQGDMDDLLRAYDD